MPNILRGLSSIPTFCEMFHPGWHLFPPRIRCCLKLSVRGTEKIKLSHEDVMTSRQEAITLHFHQLRFTRFTRETKWTFFKRKKLSAVPVLSGIFSSIYYQSKRPSTTLRRSWKNRRGKAKRERKLIIRRETILPIKINCRQLAFLKRM